MIISEVVTLGIYAFSMVFLPEYFGAFVFHLPVRRPPLKLPVILFPFFFSLHFSFQLTASAPCSIQIYRSSSQFGLDGKSRLSLR